MDIWAYLMGFSSVRELCHDPRDQAHHQGKRDHEVGRAAPLETSTLYANRTREDDSKWPQKNKDGRQELEIRLGNEHISFEVWFVSEGWYHGDLTVEIDCENWLIGGCDRVCRPRGSTSILLSRSRLEGAHLLTHFSALQGTNNPFHIAGLYFLGSLSHTDDFYEQIKPI